MPNQTRLHHHHLKIKANKSFDRKVIDFKDNPDLIVKGLNDFTRQLVLLYHKKESLIWNNRLMRGTSFFVFS